MASDLTKNKTKQMIFQRKNRNRNCAPWFRIRSRCNFSRKNIDSWGYPGDISRGLANNSPGGDMSRALDRPFAEFIYMEASTEHEMLLTVSSSCPHGY